MKRLGNLGPYCTRKAGPRPDSRRGTGFASTVPRMVSRPLHRRARGGRPGPLHRGRRPCRSVFAPISAAEKRLRPSTMAEKGTLEVTAANRPTPLPACRPCGRRSGRCPRVPAPGTPRRRRGRRRHPGRGCGPRPTARCPHITGWRVTRRIPRAGSSVLSAAACPTADGFLVITPEATSTSEKGITTSGQSFTPGNLPQGLEGRAQVRPRHPADGDEGNDRVGAEEGLLAHRLHERPADRRARDEVRRKEDEGGESEVGDGVHRASLSARGGGRFDTSMSMYFQNELLCTGDGGSRPPRIPHVREDAVRVHLPGA